MSEVARRSRTGARDPLYRDSLVVGAVRMGADDSDDAQTQGASEAASSSELDAEATTRPGPLSDRRDAAPPGDPSRYRIRELLARGGMGEVHLAWDVQLEREVALKTLRPEIHDDAFAERLEFEARVSGQLEHPNIVPVHDAGIGADGRPYYTMRRIRGRSLAELVAEGKLPGAVERLDVFRKVCDAIAFAHASGVVHRDLKPANVMVGEFGEVQVLDWGIARRAGTTARERGSLDADPSAVPEPLEEGELRTPPQTQAGHVLGTPVFMAPELLRDPEAKLDPRIDVYALGVMLYALLTDELPYRGGRIAEQAAMGRFTSPRKRRPDRVDRELDAIVRKAMARNADDRYASAAELRRDIQAYLEGEEVVAYPRSILGRVGKWTRRNRRIVAPVMLTAVLGVLAVLVLGVIYTAQLQASRDQGWFLERQAALELARAETAFARTFTETGRFDEAYAALQRAREIHRERQTDPRVVDLTEAFLVSQWSPPLLSWRAEPTADPGLNVAVSPSGAIAVFYDAAGTVRSLSIPSGDARAAFGVQGQDVSAIGFLGERPVVAVHDGAHARLLDVEGGEVVLEVGGERPVIERVTAEGRAVLVADAAGRRIVDPVTGEARVSHVPPGATLVDIDARGRLTVGHTAPLNRTPEAHVLWELESGLEVQRFEGVRHVALAPSGEWLLALGLEHADLHAVGEPEPVRRFSGIAGQTVVFSPDSTRVYVARADRRMSTLSIPGGESLGEQHITGHPFAVSESEIITGDARQWTLLPARRPTAGRFAQGVAPVAAAASPDGALVAVGNWDGTVRVWEPWTGSAIATLQGAAEGMRGVAWSPEASHLAAAGRDGFVYVWRVDDVALVRRVRVDPELAMAVCFVDETHLVASGERGEISTWDVGTGDKGMIYEGGTGTAWDLAVSPDGAWLVASGRRKEDALATLWKVGEASASWAAPDTGSAYRVRFSPDSTRFVVATHKGVPRAWTTIDRAPVVGADPLPDPLLSAMFTPDGRTIIAGTGTGELAMWDAESGEALASFSLHDGSIVDVLLVTGSEAILALDDTGNARLLDLAGPRRVRDATPGQSGDGFDLPGKGRRALQLFDLAVQRGDWGRAADHQADALAMGATPVALDRARALWATGRKEEAREVLRAAERARQILPATRRLWASAP
jgi:WD40 repeat protein